MSTYVQFYIQPEWLTLPLRTGTISIGLCVRGKVLSPGYLKSCRVKQLFDLYFSIESSFRIVLRCHMATPKPWE